MIRVSGWRSGRASVVAATGLWAWLALSAPLPAQIPGAGVGQELKRAEQDVKKAGLPTDPKPAPPKIMDDKTPATPAPPAAGAAGNAVRVVAVELRGDVEPLEKLGLSVAITSSLTNRLMTLAQVREAVRLFRDGLVNRGFFLAQIRLDDRSWASGVVILDVDLGRYGKMIPPEGRRLPGLPEPAAVRGALLLRGPVAAHAGPASRVGYL